LQCRNRTGHILQMFVLSSRCWLPVPRIKEPCTSCTASTHMYSFSLPAEPSTAALDAPPTRLPREHLMPPQCFPGGRAVPANVGHEPRSFAERWALWWAIIGRIPGNLPLLLLSVCAVRHVCVPRAARGGGARLPQQDCHRL
jgi:hypothetical protein